MSEGDKNGFLNFPIIATRVSPNRRPAWDGQCHSIFLRSTFDVKLAYLLLFFQVSLCDRDVASISNFYRTNPPARVEEFRRMPPAVTDAEFRRLVKDRLPRFKEAQDPGLNEKAISVIEPVLSFYGRADVYDLKIVDSKIPLIMADSGVVLIISTGLLLEVKSDDELLGYVAHEVGHEYFAKYSVYSRYLLTLISEQGNEPDLKRQPNELLTLIELHCDAFAALTLSHLGYEPMAFVDGIERTAREFPNNVQANHPLPSQRRYLVQQLGLKRIKPRQSPKFRQLKDLVEQPSVRSHAINGQ